MDAELLKTLVDALVSLPAWVVVIVVAFASAAYAISRQDLKACTSSNPMIQVGCFGNEQWGMGPA
jgi:hypothetical protein